MVPWWLRSPMERALILQHGRVYLRPPRGGDWRAWCQLRADSRAFLIPWEPSWPSDALTRRAFRRRLQQYNHEMQTGQGYSFLIFRLELDTLLGGISVTNVRRGVAQSASLGYWIGRPYARQGFMGEALTAVLDFAFNQLGLHRMEAACLPENTASQDLLRKVGFREEGYARGYLRINGMWQDHVLFGILAEDPRGVDRIAAAQAAAEPPRRAAQAANSFKA